MICAIMREMFRKILLISFLFLSACASMDDDYEERPVEAIYNNAYELMLDEDYLEAAKEFIEVERQHPYSIWAKRGLVMAAYSLYEDQEYVNVIDITDRFLSFHPADDNAPYMLYLKALSYYEQMSDINREQKMSYLAHQTMKELKERFPNSKYAEAVKNKFLITVNHMAAKEMQIGRELMRKRNYVGAISRFQKVVDEYEETLQVPEALYRMVEGYVGLGLMEQAKEAGAVLGYNYRTSPWYERAYDLINKYKK